MHGGLPLPAGSAAGPAIAAASSQMLFHQKFGRAPVDPSHPAALFNDVIVARMGGPWSAGHRLFVDKGSAKQAALRVHPSLRVAATRSILAARSLRSPAHLLNLLQPFIGRSMIAKPAHASGGVVMLDRHVSAGDLAPLHALALLDYAAIVQERQYAGLPRRIIVEDRIPTADGRVPDDYKFHCIHGEPLLCQIDHGRFDRGWSRMFDLPSFAPMDPGDGLAAPPGFRPASPARLAAMVEAARALAAPFDFVRVDLYDGLDGIYFGELTFTPAAGLGIAPSAAGCARMSATHRRYSETLMHAWRRGGAGVGRG